MTLIVTSLTCDIELPVDWEERQRSIGLSADNSDQYGYVRHACHANAALRSRKTFPAICRSEIWSRVLLRNISRCGAGFIHSEQLFPDEEALIVLPNGSQRILQVKRCRRLGPKCFEVGCKFTDRSGDSNSE